MRTNIVRRCSEVRRAGFTLRELLLVGAVVGMLAGLHLPGLGRWREQGWVARDLANMRQILQASALYVADQTQKLPHPTWGSDLTGPDGWAYATENRGRLPGFVQSPGNAAGLSEEGRGFSNQVAFWKIGQLGTYLPDYHVAICAKDALSHAQNANPWWRRNYISRPMKLSSYVWNATIGGYAGPNGRDLAGGTFKAFQFRPEDWQMWEANEADPFNFNDAAGHPGFPNESFSLRHSGLPNWWFYNAGTIPNPPGVVVVGTFGGAAKALPWKTAWSRVEGDLTMGNEFRNGPGYGR